jgi:hypothetical protein
MQKITGILALGCLVAAVAATAAGATNGNGKSGTNGPQTLTATCTTAGAVTVHASAGGSAWLNNHHYVLVRLQGTFTPTSGTPMSFTKNYGHKTGLKMRDTCTGTQTSTDGSFSFTATVALTGSR